ncbi:MAG: sigma factor-like helix-turn-helix DNA-binding protein [Sphingopyxis solisilvae]|uniref:sigma factor-like helix-turn-helix DNA-binding protein n=1 Tax=Sphingopyxis solisilvae TaxID=1886788 RepID=UPI004036E636
MTGDMLAVYEAAVEKLPPLTRLVFLLHRVDDLSYREIAERLAIEVRAVECCIAEALVMIGAFVDGDTPRRWRRKPLARAETELRQRHRAYCERRLRLLRIPVVWGNNGDDDQVVSQAMMRVMPPRLREIFMLHRSHLTNEQIAARVTTRQWVVRWWMFCLDGYFTLWPKTFEYWLCSTAARRSRR